MYPALGKLLATMTDPLVLVGTFVIWLVCKRWGWLAAWWVSLVYTSLIAVVLVNVGRGDAWVRLTLAATILTTMYWALSKAFAKKRTTEPAQ